MVTSCTAAFHFAVLHVATPIKYNNVHTEQELKSHPFISLFPKVRRIVLQQYNDVSYPALYLIFVVERISCSNVHTKEEQMAHPSKCLY